MRTTRAPRTSFYQQLLWPALSAELDTESYRSYGEGRFLPRAFMQYGWDHHAPDPETRKNRYAAPLQTTTEQLRGPPPTLIQTAENDELRDEGEAYARKFDDAGADVTNVRYLSLRSGGDRFPFRRPSTRRCRKLGSG